VLSITAVLTSVAGLSVGRYLGRSTARRAAQLFTQDLSQARRAAVSAREPVAIRFFEDERRYEVVAVQSGTMIVMRRFVDSDGIDLSEATLELDGDSLRFDRRGFADLSGASGPLGTATFGSGTARYTVSFNALGAARIEGA